MDEEKLKEIAERIHAFNYCEQMCLNIASICRDKSTDELRIIAEKLHNLRDDIERG